jgi:hypothetical protein
MSADGFVGTDVQMARMSIGQAPLDLRRADDQQTVAFTNRRVGIPAGDAPGVQT